MHIKQLELLGFKSFKNKTVLTFPAGITAIVGPNGCGKSNVVDALRWVLGEQSPRHLRGQEMGDVVFAGNEGNAPLGMAEVSLLLENTAADASFNGNGETLGNWTEMMISRRYFRSGESEYLLNKVPCRLRDIVEFFLGTGAGSKAYSIIEQGRVDHLINAKPEEIRALIDEAAGVSLYRSRRLAAERKMERTRDNLSRVVDLLREMERQLGSLRRQAKKAEQYRALQEELQTVDLTLLCRAYQSLSAELAHLDLQRAELLQEEARLSQEEQQILAERAGDAVTLAQEETALQVITERRHTLESTLRQGEQRKEFFLQQEQQAKARAAAADSEITALTEKQGQIDSEITHLSALHTETRQLVLQDEGLLRTYEQETSTLQHTLALCETNAEEIKTEIVDLLTQEAQVQNALSYARRRAAEVEQRLQVLAREAARLAGLRQETEQAVAATQARAARLRERLLAGQRQHEEKTGGLREVVNASEQLNAELTAAWAKQAELRARLTTLEEMEEEYERYPQGVRSIMTSAESPAGIYGAVAQMVEVPQQYERAVAAVLRDKLEYVVVSGVEDGLSAVEYLRNTQAGHGSFIPLVPRKTNGDSSENGTDHECPTVGEGTGPLLNFLTVDQRYREVAETLLGDAVLVPDLRAGLQLWRQNGVHRTFVTPDGEVITAQGIVSGGSEGFAEEALLERRREIRALREECEQHEAVVADLMQKRQDMKQQQQDLEGEILRLEAEARTLGQESEALQREEGRLEGERRRLLDKSESLAYEQQTLQSEQQSLLQEIETREGRDAELKARRGEREAALIAKQGEMAQARVDLEQQRVRCDELRVRVAERRERQQGMGTQISRLRDQFQELEERLTACRAETEGANAESEQMQTNAEELLGRLTQIATDLAAAEQEQTLRQDTCARLRDQGRAYDERLEQGRTAHTELQEVKSRIDVRLAEKRVAREHLEATVSERYATTMEEVLPRYTSICADESINETRRQELRDKIARLGEVNPGAAAELAEVEERYTFLQSQETDLRRSLDDLQNTIIKLNRESRERFRDTFIQVDVKFREVYGRLVEGGEAQITLTNEEDLTESGVEIAVQPPGKRLRSLQLLSGGEKALAALSFTFALFLIRPSPFCVLDEVDAPLDDANVGRFNQLVKEMSAATQIVLITHNKRTMEAAGTLYGVTMQEPGVSTVVSVRVS
ncbi:MAG TPA: chromosome segregation protein SMC [Candidatus Binatia bacterium]|nr:chromosome segregation protein SMC [Candidatus Binatia bacterium]